MGFLNHLGLKKSERRDPGRMLVWYGEIGRMRRRKDSRVSAGRESWEFG